MNRLRNLARQREVLQTLYEHNRVPSKEYALWLQLAVPYLLRKETLDWMEANKLGIYAYRMLVIANSGGDQSDNQAVA